MVAGRNRSDLERVVTELGGNGRALSVDFAQPESIEKMAQDLGEFDHLVSTVSMHATGPIAQSSDDEIQWAIDAKVLGPIRLVRSTADLVQPQGSFTFFSGMAAWRPRPGSVVTSMVNGALASLVQAMAVELAPVRVNAVSPGPVDSREAGARTEVYEDAMRQAAGLMLVQRVGVPADVVDATLMLLSNGFITGTVLHVDGGGRWG
ncbi:SDR family oxidoreductase [Nocardioides sp. AN3]